MKKSINLLIILIILFLTPIIAGATSQKFNASIVVTSPTTTPTTTPTSTGGGGTGEPLTPNLVLITKILDVSTVVNTKTTRQIELYNEGETKISVGISKSKDLEEITDIKEDLFDLESKEKKKIDVEIFSPLKAGIYNGKIIVMDK